ncbi:MULTISPECIES: hypothetical protein [unclassified Sphingomonas]|nr:MULTISPECIES: hypothetical protein [unclassified Sphingomonas]
MAVMWRLGARLSSAIGAKVRKPAKGAAPNVRGTFDRLVRLAT